MQYLNEKEKEAIKYMAPCWSSTKGHKKAMKRILKKNMDPPTGGSEGEKRKWLRAPERGSRRKKRILRGVQPPKKENL